MKTIGTLILAKEPPPKRKSAEELAREIATDLFTAGDGVVAGRLALILPNGKEYGGWSQRAVAARISDILRPSV